MDHAVTVGTEIRDSADCVVADAVVCEPVSAAKFPANREKNREFYRNEVLVASATVNNGVVTGLSTRIPYSTEQGIILAKQGIFAREQGILSTAIETIAGRDFRHKERLGNVRFRFSNGPSDADTYTSSFLYWLGYSGFVSGLFVRPSSLDSAGASCRVNH
jgi:hypothetical protein